MPKVMAELGRIGQRRWDNGVFTEEFLPELQGIRGVETYKEMSENDSTIGAVLFAVEMLMRQVEFNIQPAEDTEADKKAAEFVESCLYDMEETWTDTVSEILSFLTYGWSYHEIVYKRRNGKSSDRRMKSKYDDGLIGWRKLPLRSQDTLWEWVYAPDSDDLLGMTQMPPPKYEQITIPIEKALHFKTRSRKANPEGRSILRNAYRSWYFLKRIQSIEGIGMERDLAGFPVLTGPEELDLWDAEDPQMVEMLNAAINIVTSIRRDSREGLVLPNGWKLELLSSGNRRQFDTNQIIERYEKRMAMSVLADFIFLGQQTVGSFALSSDKTELFGMAIGTYLDIICEVFNNQAIPRLIDINGDAFKDITDYPTMVHGDVESADLDSLAGYVNTLIGAGVLNPDEELEKFLRQQGGLPEKLEGVDPYPVPGQQKPQNDPQTGGNENQEQTDAEDEKQAEEARKSLGRFDAIDEIKKFNPYHDASGKFTSKGGVGGFINGSEKFSERTGLKIATPKVEVDKEYFTGTRENYYAAVDPENPDIIRVNPAYFGENATKNINYKSLHQNATEESIIAHEVAHTLINKVDIEKIVNEASKKFVDNNPDDEDVKWNKDFLSEQQIAGGKISRMAINNANETFAEAFADVYANGDKAHQVSKDIVTATKKQIGGNK